MTLGEARLRAETLFKQEAHERGGQHIRPAYESAAQATREKTARLRALRLAREAKARDAT